MINLSAPVLSAFSSSPSSSSERPTSQAQAITVNLINN